jgi:excisionase family DNA binding protein
LPELPTGEAAGAVAEVLCGVGRSPPHAASASGPAVKHTSRLATRRKTLIADITLLPGHDAEHARIGIRWHTSASEELTITRIGPGRTSRQAMEIIRAKAATTTDAELAAELNAAGLTTGRGHRFDAAAVHRARNANGIRAPWSAGACDGAVTIPQACAKLGVSKSTVLDWVHTGKLAAHQTPGRRWHIPWDEAVEAHCRHMIATSIRLPARTRQQAEGVAV